MSKKQLLDKYFRAYKIVNAVDKLNCQASQIYATIEKIANDGYVPTALDEMWVDYFLEMNKEEIQRCTGYLGTKERIIKPSDYILDRYTAIIEFTYLRYAEQRDSISQGFLENETIEWLIDRLYLREATDEQLNEYWFAIDRFFRNKMMKKDERGDYRWRADVTASDMNWYRDCDSAWKETVNIIARYRRHMKQKKFDVALLLRQLGDLEV